MKALLGANLIDGTGGPVRERLCSLDRGGNVLLKLAQKGAVTLPPQTEEIDLTGLTLLPGLIDTHDHLAHKNYSLISRWEIEEPNSLHHLKTARAIEDSLKAGYTCIRDAGGLDAGFKFAVEEGILEGFPKGSMLRSHRITLWGYRRQGRSFRAPQHF
ncbi:MAG: hypothetical protein Ct9H300mP11_31500 [Chloroflexota bacterium]|nr:MAG: hypothetical protein Ct9H300mP11_31500 [Chloroflexota bacterium]